MKKFLICLAITAVSIVAFASLKGAPFPREVDKRFDVIEDALNISGTSLGDLNGSGSNQLYGYLQDVRAAVATADPVVAADCGRVIVSPAASVATLPEASTVIGCRLTFVCGTTDDFDINPADGTDVIGIAGSITGSNTTTTIAPSAGDAIRCTDLGAGVVLVAVSANLWFVERASGIITDVN